jgi:tRNA modification GTPase
VNLQIYESLCPSRPIPNPRTAALRKLQDPESSVLLDVALVLHFPAPQTVTGESLLELHIHGGPATVKAVLSAIPKCKSGASQGKIRYAEPGEFTRRAFQNNRLSLDQVEALSDTLSAETEQQRRAAVRGNSGKLGRTYEEWRKILLSARGELEALIDFSEDQHFDESPAELMSNVTVQIKQILDSITKHELASHRGELLKKGIRIAFIGPPNAGKSSLLNKIVGREASIVSREAGTTRDVVEVSLDIQGYLCTLADTAGLRTEIRDHGDQCLDPVIGAIEREGIRRAKSKAVESDVVIALASLEPSTAPQGWSVSYDHESLSILADKPSLIVVNKTDIAFPGDLVIGQSQLDIISDAMKSSMQQGSSEKPIPKIVAISCLKADAPSTHPDPGNINSFVTEIVRVFEKMTSIPPEEADLVGVTERQCQLLVACSSHLQNDTDIVISAEHLREAANCLSKITGRGEAGDVEEVLGVVFEKYDSLIP